MSVNKAEPLANTTPTPKQTRKRPVDLIHKLKGPWKSKEDFTKDLQAIIDEEDRLNADQPPKPKYDFSKVNLET